MCKPSSSWIPWGGGECPEPADTLVTCRLRDGRKIRSRLAGSLDWSHPDDPTDIVAYRLHENN